MTDNDLRYPTEAEARAIWARMEADRRAARRLWRAFFALAIGALATAIAGMVR